MGWTPPAQLNAKVYVCPILNQRESFSLVLGYGFRNSEMDSDTSKRMLKIRIDDKKLSEEMGLINIYYPICRFFHLQIETQSPSKPIAVYAAILF